MVVTINTDASYHSHYKVGAYAFYIICDQGRLMQSGALKQCHNSHHAEIQAIGNALYALLMSKFTKVQYIVINTDCTWAIDSIVYGKKIGKSGETVKQIHKFISALRAKYQISTRKKIKKPFIDWRYVPAHQEIKTKRQWVNDWCDKSAKQQLWNQINNNETIT